MATLSVQTFGTAGAVPSYSAAAGGGDQFPNTTGPQSGDVLLHVKNGGAGSITVTITSQTTCNQGSTHNLAVAVTNGSEKLIGPFDRTRFNDASGNVQVSYSGVTSVTVAALRFTTTNS